MRYSIFEYSQEKLVSLNLDVVDALLLNWFANFFCGKMEKQIFKDANGNAKIYGWVKISKIIEDLPVLGITSEKGIRLRFDAFVDKGILDRETINTQKGKKSYYRTTSVYDSLINTVALEKTQEEPAKTNTNTTETSQRNCSSLAKKSTGEKQETISHESFFTFAENQETETCKKNPQRNCSSLAEGKNFTFAQGNCTSFGLNNSLNNDSLNKDSSAIDKNNNKNNSEEDFLILKINELFNNSINFSKNLSSKLLDSLSKSNIQSSDYENYIIWAFDYLKQHCKNKEDFPGYFYKSISETALIYKFLIFSEEKIKKEKLRQEAEITCPICGNIHNRFVKCPVCHNYYLDLVNSSETEINKLKKIFNLPKEQKINYENEIKTLIQKFPLCKTAINNELKKDMELEILKIEKKYNIAGG